MLSQLLSRFSALVGRQRMLFVCTVIALTLWSSSVSFGQGNLAGACPAACGIKIQITNATLTEANDGMLMNVEWTLAQTAPEIKLKNLKVFARVKLGIDNVENTLTVAATARKATLKLARNFEFDFKDVEVLTTKVTAFAEPLPPIPITNIPTRKITGQGNDSAVEVTWGTPPPLPCSASSIAVNVAATNEKGDRLTGATLTALNVRSARIEVKGDTNKNGLRNPEATIQVINSLIGCEEIKNFPPKQQGIGSGTGSNAPNPVVTLKPIVFSEGGGRIDATLNWEVIEPPGFKATKFDFKVDTELGDGKIVTRNASANGTDRSTFGTQTQTGDLRSVAVTVKATFTNTANTAVLTREDSRKQQFTAKSALPKAAPVAPQPQSIGLNIAAVKINSEKAVHGVTVGWQVKVPPGVTVTNFEVEATVLGNQNQVKRSAVVSGQAALAIINFTFAEVGDTLGKVQVKVIANARRADGSTFQQTATGEGQPVVPPPPPPPAVQLKVTGLNSSSATSTFTIRSEWFIQLIPGVTLEGFTAEASILKPTVPVKKTVPINPAARSQNFVFSLTEAEGRTGIAVTVTANLRRADGSTFQETSTRTSK